MKVVEEETKHGKKKKKKTLRAFEGKKRICQQNEHLRKLGSAAPTSICGV